MQQTFRRVSQAIAGLAVCGLGVIIATDALAAYITKKVVTTRTRRPHKCDRANDKFVIDERADRCGGISTMYGPGWVRTSYPGLVGGAYSYVTRVRESGREFVKWSPTITTPGRYEVWVSYRETPNRTKSANYFVHTDEGVDYRIVINQNGWRNAVWAKLGVFQFDARAASANPESGYVMLRNTGRSTSEAADGAYFRLIQATGPVADTDADTVPVPGDYDEDTVRDLAVFHTLSRNWDINSSETGETEKVQFGAAGAVPVPGDYDGDGTTDLAVYYPSTRSWDIRYSDGVPAPLTDYIMTVGVAGAVPVPGNYDADNKTDLALYHQATGLWYIEYSTSTAGVPPPPEVI